MNDVEKTDVYNLRRINSKGYLEATLEYSEADKNLFY